jgi:hypothetical protein
MIAVILSVYFKMRGDSRAGLDDMEKRKLFTLLGLDLLSSRYTNCATAALILSLEHTSCCT